MSDSAQTKIIEARIQNEIEKDIQEITKSANQKRDEYLKIAQIEIAEIERNSERIASLCKEIIQSFEATSNIIERLINILMEFKCKQP